MTALLTYELDIDLKDNDQYLALSTNGIADIIRRSNYFAQDAGGALYFYKDGCYHPSAKRSVDLASRDILDRFRVETKGWSSHKATEVFRYISAGAPMLLEKPDVMRLNLMNGVFNIKTGKLEPHDPTYMTTVQLAVSYDENAECPAWEKFIGEVFGETEEDRNVAYEIVAWLMTPFTSSQKSVVLLGSGSNGKSVYLEGITEFLGERNISNISLQKLSDRFSTTQLIGKLANIAADLPNTKLASTSEFKALVGGDALLGEYKFGAMFTFKPFARCLFGCNELPDTPDNSDGFYRRLNIVQFEKTFREDPSKKQELSRTLHNPRELSGLLNKALEVLPKVFKDGITVTENMALALETHRKENDPFSIWFDDFTIENRLDGEGNELDEFWVPSVELYELYRTTIEGKPKSAIAFGKALKRYRPRVDKKQKKIDGSTVWIYNKIRARDAVEDIDWQASDNGSNEEGETVN